MADLGTKAGKNIPGAVGEHLADLGTKAGKNVPCAMCGENIVKILAVDPGTETGKKNPTCFVLQRHRALAHETVPLLERATPVESCLGMVL